MENTLYYGDNLRVLRDHVDDNSVDLIYLDPPFNSKASYNVLYKEPSGEPSTAQITAFEDTWHWTEEAEHTFQEIVETAPPNVVEMMRAFKHFVGLNDVMAYLTMMCSRLLELRRVLKDTGSIYLHCDPTASHYLKILMDTIFGKKNFRNEIVWCYTSGGVSKRHFGKKHDVLFFYSKTDEYYFDPIFRPYSEKTLKRGLTKVKGKYFSKGLRDEGAVLQDWWQIQPILSPTAKERLGYPTQKPEALLENVVKASSKEGDTVLDPFCGCGTTIAAAQKLKRNWIGIDITHLAINLIKWRMKYMFNLEPKIDYAITGEPEDLAGAKELASQNRYQFQWWALPLVGARPVGDKKKGPDRGIDGLAYFTDEKDKHKKIIVSVKSGKVSVKDMRDLIAVIKRDNAEMGIFVSLEEPTRDMKKEALATGFYKSPLSDTKYPRIQILTIEELLSGKKPEIPITIASHKKAAEFKEQFSFLEE